MLGSGVHVRTHDIQMALVRDMARNTCAWNLVGAPHVVKLPCKLITTSCALREHVQHHVPVHPPGASEMILLYYYCELRGHEYVYYWKNGNMKRREYAKFFESLTLAFSIAEDRWEVSGGRVWTVSRVARKILAGSILSHHPVSILCWITLVRFLERWLNSYQALTSDRFNILVLSKSRCSKFLPVPTEIIFGIADKN